MKYKELEEILDDIILNKQILDLAQKGFDDASKRLNEKIKTIDITSIQLDSNITNKLHKVNETYKDIMEQVYKIKENI